MAAQTPTKRKGRPTKAELEKKRRQEALARRKKQQAQQTAIALFAIGVLLTLLALITGESIWQTLHNAMFGVFGVLAYAVGPFFIWFAVAFAFGKTPAAPTCVKGAALFFSISGAMYLFGGHGASTSFGATVKQLYFGCATGADLRGGGAVSALLGWPLAKGCGDTAAKVLIVAVLFILFMLITGKTIVDLVNGVKKPIDAIAEKTAASRDLALEEGGARHSGFAGLFGARKKFDIDVELEDGKSVDVPLDPPAAKQLHKDEPAVFESQSGAAPIASLPPSEKAAPPVEVLPVDFSKEAKLRATALAAGQKGKKRDESSPIDIPLGPDFAPHQEESDFLDGIIVNKHTLPTGPAAEVVAEVYRQQETLDNLFTDFSEPEIAAETSPPAAPAREKTLEELIAEAKGAGGGAQQPAAAGVQPARGARAGEEYRFPPLSLLTRQKADDTAGIDAELRSNADALVSTLDSFGVRTRVLDIARGPSVTRYELQPEAGVRLSRIVNLADDLALNLAAEGVRIEAPIPGKAAVGVEVPNKTNSIVNLRAIVESETFRNAKSPLTFAIGKDISGQVRVGDISGMPHLLIAGSTGMGKSVCINSMIVSLVYKSTPKDLQLILVDPKMVEFTCYTGLPHLYIPVVTDPKKAAGALGSAVGEMLKRYKLFSSLGVRNVEEYNRYVERKLKEGDLVDDAGDPLEKKARLVIIIDELADLMMTSPTEVEDAICRLAQMGRAAGIHLVVATQRPSVDVITGTIKNNIPTRIAFKVSSQVDSRTILDGSGAEKLIGRGDMLFQLVGKPKPVRIQGSYVSEDEVAKVVGFLKQYAVAQYNEQFIRDMEENAAREKGGRGSTASDEDGDPMLEDAVEVVVEAGQASTSLLQRRLKLGYARAARIMDEMEQMGIVGPQEGSKPRAVLLTRQMWQERLMRQSEE